MNDLQEWTVMFFFAGDNSIAASMISQLKAITDAGYQEDTTVLVHFDPNTNDSRARVFDVNRGRKNDPDRPRTVIGDGKDFFVRNIREDCDKQPEIKGKSAEDTLKLFLDYGRTNFRAKNYVLFLIGHGMIVANDSFLPDTDVDFASAITLKKLGSVLKTFADRVKTDGDNFQLVGFHSCSMSAVEVAYELKDTARYMLGTQGLAFPGSWPYRQLLKMVFDKIDEWTREGAKEQSARKKLQPDYDKLTDEIMYEIQKLSFYNADDFLLAGYSADLCLCSLDSKRLDPLTGALKKLSVALQAGLKDSRTKELILLAHWKAQSYWQETYTDLFDFCRCVAEQCDPENELQNLLAKACSRVMDELASEIPARKDPARFDRLVVYSDYLGPAYQYSHGLSIYFPWAAPSDAVLNRYEGYEFTQAFKPAGPTNGRKREEDDSWLGFLNAYFDRTQRSARGNDREITISPNGNEPATLLEADEGKPTPSLGGGEGKPTPSLGGGEGKPTPSLGIGEGKPTPSLGIGEGKPTPSLGIGEGKPTPSLGGGEGKPTPSLGGGEGKPTPSMGGGGFNFTVTKNYPAPRDQIISSRPKSAAKAQRRRARSAKQTH